MGKSSSTPRAWEAPRGEDASSVSGTRKRITHEIDADYGEGTGRARPSLAPKALERGPSRVATLRAPTPGPMGEVKRLRKALAPWDVEIPKAYPRSLDASLLAIAADEEEVSIEIEEVSLSALELEALLAAEDPDVATLVDVRLAFERGDLLEVMSLGAELLGRRPDLEAARRYVAGARAILVNDLVDELGGAGAVPRSRVRPNELRALELEPAEAFVLSLVDGTATVTEIVDMSGRSRLEALVLLARLSRRRIVRSG